MQNSQQQRDNDLAQAALNVNIANLSVNILILFQVEQQIALQKQSMADTAKFQQELLRTLDIIIKNQ